MTTSTYTKQANRIHKAVLTKHPKGAKNTICKYRLMNRTSAEMHKFKDALRSINDRLVWAWNWPNMGEMSIHVAQRRK